MKKLAIIGANDFQNRLILRAKELGYETHVFAWEDGAVGKETADFFYPISIVEKERILEICRRLQPDGVCSIGSDTASITVNYLGRELGLRGYNSEECVRNSTNKFYMRQCFKKAGLATPDFMRMSNISEIDFSAIMFPVIVKPTDRSGSRSVTKVHTREELMGALIPAIEDSFEHRAIVEEIIRGEEYSCECMTYQGKHTCLAMTKKFTTGEPHFIETGHIEPSLLSVSEMEQVKQVVFASLDALHVNFGASHAEFRVEPGGQPKLIEIGARMGGDCIGSDLVELSTGYDYMKMVIDVSVGREPDFAVKPHYQFAMVKFVLTQDDFAGLKKIQETDPDLLKRVSTADTVGAQAVVDSSTRAGYYILALNDEAKAKQIMKTLF